MTAVVPLAPRPWLADIRPYVPGVHAPGGDGSLASNESPIGASPAVAAAVARALPEAHLYPDPLARELRSSVAAHHGVDPEQVVVGNGSDELIYLLALAYLAGGGRAVCAEPAYRIDEISAQVVGGSVVKVPLVDWRHDLEAMAQVEADIAYVVNPHNPTGTTCPSELIREFVDRSRSGLVVVDEAYVDFTADPEQETMIPLVAGGRVAVLRTFSKVHGLAGLRVGYLVASREVADTLRKVRAPFTVNSLSQAAALAASTDLAHRDRVRGHTLRVRGQLIEALRSAGLRPVDSEANFVLVPSGHETAVVDHFAVHGVSVRPGAALGVPGAFRISVPSDAGLDLVRAALDRLPPYLAESNSRS